MDNIEFLNIEEVIVIHEKMIILGGGSSGLRSIELLHSAIERPKASFSGNYLYPSIIKMGAALLHSLVKNHPFIDGNKRTAFFTTLRFLEKNNINLKIDFTDSLIFMKKVATNKYNVADITNWIQSKIIY